MRKFFGQKNKQKFLPGTSLTMPLVPVTTDDDPRMNDSTSGRLETTDSGEKLTKLFVVVSGRDRQDFYSREKITFVD